MYEILNDRATIQIQGACVVKFLQNLVTNDISKLNYCYSYMLTNQGRYLFDCFVYVHSTEQIFIDINKNDKESLIQYLNFYKLRAKIEIIDQSKKYYVTYSMHPITNALITIRDPRYSILGYRSIVEGNSNEVNNDHNKLYLETKYNLAIVDGYEDLVKDKSIPIEYGAEQLNAISYDKGCYLGQEVVSRAKYQGVVRKKIFKVMSNTDLLGIQKGQDILSDGCTIGVICSVYGSKAIALIREDRYLTATHKVMVGEYDVRISLASWYS